MTKHFLLGKSTVIVDEISEARKRHGNAPCYGGLVTGGPFIVTDDIAIFVIEGLSHSVRVYTANNIPDNSWFFFTVPHIPFTNQMLSDQIHLFMELTKNRFSIDRLVMMANTHADVSLAHSLGLTRSFFCNHNCWLDWGIYKITRDLPDKSFDLVINTRPEYNFKRPWLAMNVKPLCVIQGSLHRRDDYWDLNQLKPKYINSTKIPSTDVNNLLSRAFVGGIFSSQEGANYASSEYLLAGLPVVSTHSIGGRDYWYDNDNSIIVEPDTESVAIGVRTLKDRLLKGKINPLSIRQRHIEESVRLRKVFMANVEGLLIEHSICLDVESIFNAYYTDKFIRTIKYGYDRAPW